MRNRLACFECKIDETMAEHDDDADVDVGAMQRAVEVHDDSCDTRMMQMRIQLSIVATQQRLLVDDCDAFGLALLQASECGRRFRC